jgi:putative tricarboxylic transport membrane protein
LIEERGARRYRSPLFDRKIGFVIKELTVRKANIIIGLILLGVSGFYYFSTKGLPPPTKTENLGAAFFPTLLASLLAILALLLIVNSLSFRRASDQEEEKSAVAGGERLEEDSFSAEGISYKFLFGTAVLCVLYAILLPVIGYLISTPLFLISLIRLLRKGKWVLNVTISILLTASLYLLFARALSVSLPPGILLD